MLYYRFIIFIFCLIFGQSLIWCKIDYEAYYSVTIKNSCDDFAVVQCNVNGKLSGVLKLDVGKSYSFRFKPLKRFKKVLCSLKCDPFRWKKNYTVWDQSNADPLTVWELTSDSYFYCNGEAHDW